MHTKEEILEQVQSLIAELFEVEKEAIVSDAQLYEDLDLDSIDAIDMIVKLQAIIGRTVKPEDFRNVRTVDDIVEVVYKLLQE